jgi:P pilus assembly chaperone PapD
MTKYIYLALLLIIVPNTSYSQAIVLNPNRIVFEGKDRKAQLTVNNPSDEEQTYRIQVLKKRMLENGKIVDLDEPLEDEKFANKLIRYSPRTFTVPPKSSQVVRVSLRKPKDLEEGEYRSHMRVGVVPKAKPPSINSDDKVSINIQVNYGITIPLIVRHGDLDYKVSIGDTSVSKDEKGGYVLNTEFNREGSSSVYGDISILHKNSAGDTNVLKFLPGISVFYPTPKRTFSLPLTIPENVDISSGSILVKYVPRDKGKELFAQKEISL